MPVAVFGGGAVQTAYVSFTALDISAHSITLVWPTSYFNVPEELNGIFYNVLAASMTVNNAALNPTTVTLPDATQSSVGSNFIITNIGNRDFQLLLNDGITQLILIPNMPNTSNSFWVQLIDNSTTNGTWQFVQFGAGTSQAQSAALAGNGLVALGVRLDTNVPVQTINFSPHNVVAADRANLLIWNTGAGNINLPAINTVPAGFYFSVNNEGSGILTISGNVNIDNKPMITVSLGQSLSIISDGALWWTLGFGQNISSSNFAPGSSIAPSITFTTDTTTGMYYYQTPFPPVNPPGIGFTVGSSEVSNMTASGLYMNAGKNIVIQDSTNVAQTAVNTNSAFGQLAWTATGLLQPSTLNITGTNVQTSITIGPFGPLVIASSTTNGFVLYNSLNIWTISNSGSSLFQYPVDFASNIIVTGSAQFNNTVSIVGALTLTVPLAIADGGTGQTTQQSALNALMPPTPAIGDIVFYDATNNWVRLPIGSPGQVLTVQTVSGNNIPQWV